MDFGDLVVDVKKLAMKKSTFDITSPIGVAGIRGARGFVPAFSAIAGEIAASKTAGYKKPVTPSQVKKMNIPGAGRTAYNTQESVFKLPGMRQPFIRPPSNSGAAANYTKAVKKKHNFHPYKDVAAKGFVPNMAPDAGTAAIATVDLLKLMQGKIYNRLHDIAENTEWTAQDLGKMLQSQQDIGNSITQKLEELKGGPNPTSPAGNNGASVDLNFEPFTNAASRVSESVDKLGTELAAPLKVDTGAITSSLSELTNALGSMSGTVTVEMPDNINVTVGGAGALTGAVQDLMQSRIPGIVAEAIKADSFVSDIIRRVKEAIT